jgi:hypothetical protein
VKKILSVIALIAIVFAANVLTVSAQYAAPRYDTTGIKGDNTGRVLTYDYITLNDFAGADSAIVNTTVFETEYKINLLDSFTLKQPNIYGAHEGDKIRLVLYAATGTPFLKFYGNNWISQGKATLTTNKTGSILFRFDGVINKWVEVSRLLY